MALLLFLLVSIAVCKLSESYCFSTTNDHTAFQYDLLQMKVCFKLQTKLALIESLFHNRQNLCNFIFVWFCLIHLILPTCSDFKCTWFFISFHLTMLLLYWIIFHITCCTVRACLPVCFLVPLFTWIVFYTIAAFVAVYCVACCFLLFALRSHRIISALCWTLCSRKHGSNDQCRHKPLIPVKNYTARNSTGMFLLFYFYS